MNEIHCLGEQVIGFCKQQGCLPVVRCRSAQLLTVANLLFVPIFAGLRNIPLAAADIPIVWATLI